MALQINQWTQLLVNKKRCQKNADGKRKEKNPHCFRWATANQHCTTVRFTLLENSLSFVKQRVMQEVWMLGCVFVFVPSHYNFQRVLFVHVWRSYKSRYCVFVCCVKNGEIRSDYYLFFEAGENHCTKLCFLCAFSVFILAWCKTQMCAMHLFWMKVTKHCTHWSRWRCMAGNKRKGIRFCQPRKSTPH